MTKRSKRENDEDLDNPAIDEEEAARADDTDPDPADDDTPAETREDGSEEDPKDEDAAPAARSAKPSVSRRDFIYGLCEAAGLSITTARKFDESRASLSEIRSQILKKRSAGFENVSNTRSISTTKPTKTLSQRAAEVYKK